MQSTGGLHWAHSVKILFLQTIGLVMDLTFVDVMVHRTTDVGSLHIHGLPPVAVDCMQENFPPLVPVLSFAHQRCYLLSSTSFNIFLPLSFQSSLSAVSFHESLHHLFLSVCPVTFCICARTLSIFSWLLLASHLLSPPFFCLLLCWLSFVALW